MRPQRRVGARGRNEPKPRAGRNVHRRHGLGDPRGRARRSRCEPPPSRAPRRSRTSSFRRTRRAAPRTRRRAGRGSPRRRRPTAAAPRSVAASPAERTHLPRRYPPRQCRQRGGPSHDLVGRRRPRDPPLASSTVPSRSSTISTSVRSSPASAEAIARAADARRGRARRLVRLATVRRPAPARARAASASTSRAIPTASPTSSRTSSSRFRTRPSTSSLCVQSFHYMDDPGERGGGDRSASSGPGQRARVVGAGLRVRPRATSRPATPSTSCGRSSAPGTTCESARTEAAP